MTVNLARRDCGHLDFVVESGERRWFVHYRPAFDVLWIRTPRGRDVCQFSSLGWRIAEAVEAAYAEISA